MSQITSTLEQSVGKIISATLQRFTGTQHRLVNSVSSTLQPQDLLDTSTCCNMQPKVYPRERAPPFIHDGCEIDQTFARQNPELVEMKTFVYFCERGVCPPLFPSGFCVSGRALSRSAAHIQKLDAACDKLRNIYWFDEHGHDKPWKVDYMNTDKVARRDAYVLAIQSGDSTFIRTQWSGALPPDVKPSVEALPLSAPKPPRYLGFETGEPSSPTPTWPSTGHMGTHRRSPSMANFRAAPIVSPSLSSLKEDDEAGPSQQQTDSRHNPFTTPPTKRANVHKRSATVDTTPLGLNLVPVPLTSVRKDPYQTPTRRPSPSTPSSSSTKRTQLSSPCPESSVSTSSSPACTRRNALMSQTPSDSTDAARSCSVSSLAAHKQEESGLLLGDSLEARSQQRYDGFFGYEGSPVVNSSFIPSTPIIAAAHAINNIDNGHIDLQGSPSSIASSSSYTTAYDSFHDSD